IWSQTQTGQALGQAGVLPATASAQSTQSWSRNGGVGNVAVGRRVRNDRVDRQTQLTSQGTANQKHGTAAFCLEEAATTAVIRTGDEAVINALIGHLLGLSGGVHVAEAGQRLNLDVIDTTGNHQVGLAQSNLVHAFFDGHRSGGTSTNR